MAGQGGVPANATAVTGNLTVTAQTSGGYLFIGPVRDEQPDQLHSQLPGRGRSGQRGHGGPGSGGTLSVTYVASAGAATAHVIFDVTGYFVPDASGSRYVALNPARLLDTRNGTGLAGPSSSHVARTFAVAGQGGVPANATAVTGNLTVTAQTSGGYLFVGPNATDNPTSSTLNFPVGDDRANGVTVALGWRHSQRHLRRLGRGRHGSRDLRRDRLLRARRGRLRLRPAEPDAHPRLPQRYGPVRSVRLARGAVVRCGEPRRGGRQRHCRDRQPDRDRPDQQRLPVHRPERDQRPDQLDPQLPGRRRPGQRGHGGPGWRHAQRHLRRPGAGPHRVRHLRRDRLLRPPEALRSSGRRPRWRHFARTRTAFHKQRPRATRHSPGAGSPGPRRARSAPP